MGILSFEIRGWWFLLAIGSMGLAIEFSLAVHLSDFLLIFGHNYPIKAL
jgi:hypothetical protein